jgi:hypothetical protein
MIKTDKPLLQEMSDILPPNDFSSLLPAKPGDALPRHDSP